MPAGDDGGLFDDRTQVEAAMPLAARMRPRDFGEFVGQAEVVGEQGVLRRALMRGDAPSLILWGPPGTGKTTLARLIASTLRARFSALSAVTSGVADLRKEVDEAQRALRQEGRRTVLFVDELHRFSRAQQDAILPHVEAGTVRFIGATTENPSFSVNNALLSRCHVVALSSLDEQAMETLIDRAIADPERGLGGLSCRLSPEGRTALIRHAGGDARTALNALELAASACIPTSDGYREIGEEAIREAYLHPALRHDRQGDLHFDIASALIKSIRGSDADAAVYWLARLLEAGDDPMFVARRLVISASEDIGLADPSALSIAVAAMQATHMIGLPEARLMLSEAAIYLALAPKSNSALRAYEAAREDVQRRPGEPVPLHLRNAVTGLMRAQGYGQGYRYAHDDPTGVAEQEHLPQSLRAQRYYDPTEHGREEEFSQSWAEIRRRIRPGEGER
jgi:putative ATPase